MVKNTTFASAFALVLLLAPASALADEAKAPEAPAVPAVHHAPQNTARLAEDLAIGAVFERSDVMKRAVLVYKGAGSTEGEVEFARSSNADKPYVAVIPGAAVRGPQLGYAIEIETTGGERLPAFATRAEPYPITVLDSAEDAREAALLARLGGRRSVFSFSGEYVSFGTSHANVHTLGAGGAPVDVPRSVADQYYRGEAAYTYRLLGTVSEFGMRAGAVRGRSLVPGEIDPNKYDVGLNYGAPRVRLRAADWCHLEGELLISVTEVGFSSGGGGAILLGDPYGSKLTVGFEAVQVFGVRGYTRLDVVANRRLTLSPIVEVTDMPHADTAGVRLLAEGNVLLGFGFQATVRGGYQARTFDQGGPSVGAGLAYAF